MNIAGVQDNQPFYNKDLHVFIDLGFYNKSVNLFNFLLEAIVIEQFKLVQLH